MVEDDFDARAALVALLRREGFDAQGARDGGDAISVLEGGWIPVVMLADLHMPGIVGQELLEYARSNPEMRRTAIAVITAAPEIAPPGYKVFTKPAAFADVLEFCRHRAERRTAA